MLLGLPCLRRAHSLTLLCLTALGRGPPHCRPLSWQPPPPALLSGAMRRRAQQQGTASMQQADERPAAGAADGQDGAGVSASGVAGVSGRRRRARVAAGDGPAAAAAAAAVGAAVKAATEAAGGGGTPSAGQAKRRRRASAAPGGAEQPGSSPAAAPPGADAGAGPVLLELGQLVMGHVAKRPSATVRTPYVADVHLLPGGEAVLAHTPALDCAGMIVPGARVHMTANAPRRDGQQPTKTTHAVQLAEETREDGSTALVGAHPALAERLAEAAARRGLLPLPPALATLGPYSVSRQVAVGGSRFDLALDWEEASGGSGEASGGGGGGRRLLLEVKNVVCADFPEGGVPAGRGKVGVYTSAAGPGPYRRTAIFPHGAAKKGVGVVSDRAVKHLHELINLQRRGADGQGRRVQTAVLFVVNRSDCHAFRACHEADMLFARMLMRTQAEGVLVLAHDVVHGSGGGGAVAWGKPLPVVFPPEVGEAAVDEEHLAAVLAFNASDPRTHWKRGKA